MNRNNLNNAVYTVIFMTCCLMTAVALAENEIMQDNGVNDAKGQTRFKDNSAQAAEKAAVSDFDVCSTRRAIEPVLSHDQKADAYLKAGITESNWGRYDADMLIAYGIGGTLDPKSGYNIIALLKTDKYNKAAKDKLDAALRIDVCRDGADLLLTQESVAKDWKKLYDARFSDPKIAK